MKMQRLTGSILLVVGVLLFLFGMDSTDSFVDRWTSFFHGSFTDKTMWYMVAGIASGLVGLSMIMFSNRRSAA